MSGFEGARVRRVHPARRKGTKGAEMTEINLEEILVVNLAGALMLLVLPFLRLKDQKPKRLDDHLMNWMVALTLVALIAETGAFLVDGVPGRANRFLSYFLNGYLFLASSAVATLWVCYVDYHIYRSLKRLRKRAAFIFVPFLLVAALALADCFGAGNLFCITADNVYTRGRLTALSYIVLFYDYIYSTALAVIAVKWRYHIRFFPVHYFILPCALGTIVQGLRYGISVGWFCTSLAFFFIQMQMQSMSAFLDDLSGLYNRRYYNHFIQKIANSRTTKVISGVMLDVNNFKRINDRYGHLAGDNAIRNLGKILANISSEHSTSFRLSGDEFVIISPGYREVQTQRLIQDFQRSVEAFNRNSGLPYALSVSVGYTVFETANFDSDRFLHQMDMKMYEAKTAYYARNDQNRRNALRRREA